MKEVVKLIGFILVAIGTTGLLLEDFVLNWGSVGCLDVSLIFGAVNALGLATLAFSFWVMK